MLTLSRFLSIFPFTVNVSGKKRDLIVKLGDLFYGSKKLQNVSVLGTKADFEGSDFFKIWAYASQNFFRDFEKSELGALMFENLSTNSIFIDIGANLGGYSALARKMGSQVYLFEPVEELYSVLAKNPELFGQAYHMALSNYSGKASFNTSSENIGGSSLVESNQPETSGYDGTQEVLVKTFDEVWSELGIDSKIDLIKIDVEGNEMETLEGMTHVLESDKVKCIWCEVRGMSSDRNPGSYIKVCKFLESYSFVPYRCVKGKKHYFDVEKTKNCPQFFDLLFVKHEYS